MSNRLLDWGIDLGGTKCECVVLDGEEVLLRHRIPTERAGGYDHMIGQIAKLVAECADKIGQRPTLIGMGTPGARDPQTGLMKNCNTTELNGKPFKEDLERRLGVPVLIANDANCFALAETHLGAVRQHHPDAKVVFGIIMGTGVGSGIVINGRILNGHHGIAGEWGHNVLSPDGPECYCGKRGCVETFISGPALEAWYEAKAKRHLPLAKIAAATAHDHVAKLTIDRLHLLFGQALANVVNILDPDVIVIGGGVGNVQSLYSVGRETILPFLFNPRFATPIIAPALGDSAGVFGAALLARGEFQDALLS
ncbi:ROK family protein [Aeromonas hydrophila]|uniref:ROK family protein n=1 Tax=Aeromonas hydrophila TaxID=644 RepID=UPI000954BA51|nr:ROK family protein [Aeromonas hydrophila]WAF90003.1 ROK family protein [Aeromonas hydrophila]WAG02719.1 ROK family protein [Aeromonas hydrophila]SIR27432.1 Sugar kinase of the NBD/HSP70 family, may contain an N-terminal HTH domain [Aeromonas hydrophila]SIR43510.1 Sugar kinase of the NBD/HSP70 family, may contain an N-terminal HTH domain [Aeromonas hydrophila]